jgi:hypothetical protein
MSLRSSGLRLLVVCGSGAGVVGEGVPARWRVNGNRFAPSRYGCRNRLFSLKYARRRQGVLVLVLAADGRPSGVEVDVAAKKLSASGEVIATVFGTLERMWSRALDWAEDNQIQVALLRFWLCL